MSGYVVASYQVSNPDAYPEYVQKVIPTLQAHNAEILVADYESEAVEGDCQHVTVVIKFESVEAAKKWYNSPEYQEVLPLRLDNTSNGTLVFTKQFVMPGA